MMDMQELMQRWDDLVQLLKKAGATRPGHRNITVLDAMADFYSVLNPERPATISVRWDSRGCTLNNTIRLVLPDDCPGFPLGQR